MSYSRWSTSRWYTYWCANNTFDRDDQCFDVCGIKVFTYKELKDDLEGCLKKAEERSNQEETKPVTKEELEELKGYMQEFISDIESYKDVNFYEDLKIAKITPELMTWYWGLKDSDDIKPLVEESFKVLFADEGELPLLISELETDIGKSLIEKRFRGKLKQFTKGAVVQLGEYQTGSLGVDSSNLSSSI